MLELDEHNAAAYLREHGYAGADEPLEVSFLAGGVSNQVLYVRRSADSGEDFVLKQARGQLRTADPWFCTVERIWREVAVLEVCADVLARHPEVLARTPRVLFADRDNYCFAMTAAPVPHEVWKQRLLRGSLNLPHEQEIAQQCGELLGVLHAETWEDEQVAHGELADREIFDDLRLDPYYRTTAARQPEFAKYFEELIQSVLAHRLCLVHADFSPKNLLVSDAGLLMVDFETGHYGDPAFDLGFFLTHLMLKSFHLADQAEEYLTLPVSFWNAYRLRVAAVVGEGAWSDLERRAMQNLAGCAWARLDGKSPVEYLTHEPTRAAVRGWCQELFRARPTFAEMHSLARSAIAALPDSSAS